MNNKKEFKKELKRNEKQHKIEKHKIEEPKIEEPKIEEPKIEEHPMIIAIESGDFQAISSIIETTAKEEIPEATLYFAAKKNQINTIQLLLDKGLNINTSYNNWTMLHVGASEGLKEMVDFLLKKGADPTIKSISTLSYQMCKDKETRNVFRKFAGNNPHMWDYERGMISLLTDEMEQDQKKRAKEKKKQKEKHRKLKEQEEKDHKKREEQLIEEAKENLKKQIEEEKLNEREKRALAAERRLTSLTKSSITCAFCKKNFSSIPFDRLTFKYCSTGCVMSHKKELGDK